MDYLMYIYCERGIGFSRRIKLQGMGCSYLIKISQPYYTWKKIGEHTNQENKRGTYKNMVTNGSPKPL